MQKLEISQLMKLSEQLVKHNWLVTLMDMDNTDRIEKFFEFIGKKELLDQTLQNTEKQKTR